MVVLWRRGHPPIDLGDDSRYTQKTFLGDGAFGQVFLMRDRETGQEVAVKFIPRGNRVDHYMQREIMCHRQLSGHTNIIQFHEVFLTPTHLGIAMEYASGGTLFDRVASLVRFREEIARYFFQQIVCGLAWCHSQRVCHRDVKLENLLLDGSAAPRIKICDFGCAKSSWINSKPNTVVGTPSYIAPEVIETLNKEGEAAEYDGELADVWSCGVALYVMLVGAYPFQDPSNPRDAKLTVQRILAVQYSIPADVPLTPACADLLARIFVRDPAQRISMQQIRQHPWFLTNLPRECQGDGAMLRSEPPLQLEAEILSLLQQARQAAPASSGFPEEDARGETDVHDHVGEMF